MTTCMSIQNLPSKVNTSTKLRREPTLVDLDRICMTDKVETLAANILDYTPICLVPWQGGLFSIVDGNRRYAAKRLARSKKIMAWVLKEGDQKIIYNDPLASCIEDWVKGLKTLGELTMEARERAVGLYGSRPAADIKRGDHRGGDSAIASPNLDPAASLLIRALEDLGYQVSVKRMESLSPMQPLQAQPKKSA